MDADTKPRGSERLQEVLALVRAKIAAPERATIEDLMGRYYGQVDPEDLDERQPADLYGAALSHWSFARKREPGRAKVRVFNPTLEEHGWQSTHTIIEIVNDDMPFLVDSVTMEANRHGLTLHLIVHPLLAVVRDAGGTLTGLAAEGKDVRRESFIHVEVDRTTDPARLDALAADIGRVLLDVRDGGRGLEQDAGEAAGDRRRPRRASAAARRRRAGRRQGVPGLARERSLHAARLPLPRPRDGRRRRRAAHRRRLGTRDPARDRRPRGRGELRRAASGAAGLRALPRSADHHEGEFALDRASPRLSRLCRRQALRREGRGLRRASLPRALHVDRVQREAGRHPAAAAQDGQRDRARRPRAGQPRRQGAHQHPRNVSARRAPADERGRSLRDRDGRSCTSASGSASGCSSGATRSGASSRASSSRRARTTRPNCARSGRRF